ncbi:hypothetical protein D0Z07_7356 [Hyphodiscus hymeniophilus]|uniref:CENP-V/GFA domain-containing protein n=1 Tax=Hyphodiscus hymeniophilus TaxID=353542 RepID=A0A9P6VEJ2_9HELO|nr:hypothetical protein D0Z07_7356 [Hyphodiscus hymeniophilus]
MAPSKDEKATAKRSASCSSQEVEGEKNEWKFRAPYKIHAKDGDDKFRALYEGGCHCGRVKYQLSREKPLDAKFCHCSTCQVLHGAPFQWAAIFHKEDINFTHGHHDLGWYDSGDKTTVHKLPCKVSCAYCRSPIMDEGRNMILLFPSLIKFKNKAEKAKFDVTCHMFYEQRLVDIPDGKPKWSGMSGQSDLIEDSPADAIKKRKREVEEEENNEGEKDGKAAKSD